jgi:CheY-like chemotaxis protein
MRIGFLTIGEPVYIVDDMLSTTATKGKVARAYSAPSRNLGGNMKGRILIIDDEAEIRRNLTFGLMQEGYHVVACPDGVSAVHELNLSRERGVGYDCMVTDIFMPDIDGLKILKVIKAQYPDLPVVVITGFGDVSLELEALSEHNTGYLDKPFEVPQLVAAIEALSPGSGTLDAADEPEAEQEMRESHSSYLTVRLTDEARSLDIFWELSALDGVQSCVAVRGDVDIILLAHASSLAAMQEFYGRVEAIDGIAVVSASAVERPKLDRDIQTFVDVYKKSVKQTGAKSTAKSAGVSSYFIVDIEKEAIQQIFTTVFFLDNVIFCDVIDEGTKLLGLITDYQAVGRPPRIIEKISEIDGVLRVREARIIELTGGW